MRLTAQQAAAAAKACGVEIPKKKRQPKPKVTLAINWAAWGLPEPHRELRFDKERFWRFDFAWTTLDHGEARCVALEQEGGVWTQGRHSRGQGMCDDMRKYARAYLLGWVVFRATPQMLKSGEAQAWIREALGIKEKT